MPRKKVVKVTEEELLEVSESETLTQTELTRSQLTKENLLSSGSKVLDVNCTDTIDGCFLKGKYYLMVGSSSSGKTWLVMNLYAEAAKHPVFQNYHFVYDGPEHGNQMDVAYFFGKKTANKINSPFPGRVDKNGNDASDSESVEDFYDALDNWLTRAEQEKTGIIYVLDSMDSLSSEAADAYIEDKKKARESGKEIKTGTYGDGKAKYNAQHLRKAVYRLEKSGSILVIICQEKDDLNGGIYASKTFSGGKTLTYLATLQLWLKVKGPIVKVINGVNRTLGTATKVIIKKNRLTGMLEKNIDLSFYHQFGIDDIGDVINFLCEQKYWGISKGKVEFTGIPFGEEEEDKPKVLSFEKLARYIESNNYEDYLYAELDKCWKQIKDDIKKAVVRKKRYE